MSEILRYIKPSHIKQVVEEQEERTPSFKPWLKDWKKNLDGNKPRITKQAFWREMVHARLTSQNKVELVQEFMEIRPFPLAHERLLSERDVKDFIAKQVRQAKLRFPDKTGRELACNFALLAGGAVWNQARDECKRLTRLPATTDEKERQRTEREVARSIEDTFKGFGPKQSRNLLQMLRLTRYETPIDSRVVKWLNSHFPRHAQKIDPQKLSRKRYEPILDDIQQLCQRAKIYPRIFDMAVFSEMGRSGSPRELRPGLATRQCS